MEAFWIFPLYFVSPIIGIILFVSGIIRFIKRKELVGIIVGIILIALPIFHFLLMNSTLKNYEKEVVGNYALAGKNEIVLQINSDGTFQLMESSGIPKFGSGKWEIHLWDIVELDLHFHNNHESELAFELNNKNDELILEYDPFQNSGIELIKK